MNNPLIYFMGLLAIMTITSLIFVAAKENTNATLNDTIQNNTPLNTTLNFLNNDKTLADETKPEEIGTIDNLSVNASENLYNVSVREDRTLGNTILNNTNSITVLNKTAVYVNKPENGNNLSTNVSASFYTSIRDSKKTIFTVGGNGKVGEQAFEVGMPLKPAKDASLSGYIIQATPHGTV